MLKKTVLITGCSSGIGKALALQLADHDYDVIATVRSEEAFAALKKPNITPFFFDLSDPDQPAKLIGEIKASGREQLSALINNAGYCQLGAMADLSIATIKQQFEVNVFGLAELTRLCLPLLQTSSNSKIINLNSINSFVVFPLTGCYSASKFALAALTDALRMELKLVGSNTKVVSINPGPIDTDFMKNALKSLREVNEASQYQKFYDKLKKMDARPAEITTRPIINLIIKILESKKPKAHYYIPLASKILALLVKWLPKKVVNRMVVDVLSGLKAR